MEKGSNLILIGMPGVGKSSVGVVLAKVLNMAFLDSDLVIQARTGKSLPQLISERGPDGFLRLEEAVNASLEAENTIIATGGSAVYGRMAMEHFRQLGTILYLAADFDVISARLGDLDRRGVVHGPGQTLRDLFEERTRLYEAWADVTVRERGAEFRIDETIKAVREALGK